MVDLLLHEKCTKSLQLTLVYLHLTSMHTGLVLQVPKTCLSKSAKSELSRLGRKPSILQEGKVLLLLLLSCLRLGRVLAQNINS